MPTSGTTRRIRLPGDLARSLEYLDDAELRKLQDAVNNEIERRSRKTLTKKPVRPADKEAVRIPEGQVNLIRASFKAGLKPGAIARSLGISPHWIYDRIHNGTIQIALDSDTGLYLFPDRPRTITSFQQLRAGKVQELRF